MTEPLHTDDPAAEGNLTAEEYQRQHEERAARLGDAGLHIIPDDLLAKALSAEHGMSPGGDFAGSHDPVPFEIHVTPEEASDDGADR